MPTMNKYIFLTLGVLGLVFGGLTTAVQAEDQATTCTSVDASSMNLSRGLSEREAAYENAKTGRIQTIEKGRDASDIKLIASRKKADAAYIAQYETLEASVTTDEEIAAVQAFEKAMNDAVLTQRTATDAAIKKYRDGVDDIILNRNLTIDAALTKLEATIDDIVTQAKESCGTTDSLKKLDPSTNGIATARREFRATIATLSDTDEKLASLSKERDTAITKINKVFNAKVQAETVKLKAAFGQ